jgi:hypothetical protein
VLGDDRLELAHGECDQEDVVKLPAIGNDVAVPAERAAVQRTAPAS